jgi:outer membrane protein TolC
MISLSATLGAEEKGLKSANLIFLSIDDYVRTVLKQGDRALTAYNNYENSTLNYKVAFRQMWLPTMSVASEVSRDRSEVKTDVTDVTKGESASGSATLAQPLFVTGGRLSATYSDSTSRTEISTGIISHSYTRPSYTASFTQPLFLFVGNSDWRSWKRTKLSFDIASDNYKREMQSIENEARSKYYDVLLKEAQLDVEKTKLEASRRGHRITKALVEGGRLAGIELARSDVRLQRDIRRMKNAETVLQQAINDALEFASMKIESKVEFTSKLDYQVLSLELDPLIDYALEHRPDYIAAKRQLDLAELSVRETLEANNPTLNAVASISHAETGNGTPPDTISKSWSSGLNLTWPLFDSGITGLRAKAARNSLENDKVAFRGLERSIRTEVTNAYLDVKRNELQLDDLKTSKEQARRSVEAVRLRYQNGRDRLLDVFDSESDLRDLELEYLNVLISANLAKDRLALLVGNALEEIKR